MKVALLFSVFLLLAIGVRVQLRLSALSPAAVPAALRRTGRVVQALRYTDRTGTNPLDAAWQAAPAPFRQPAARLWQRHRDEKLSE